MNRSKTLSIIAIAGAATLSFAIISGNSSNFNSALLLNGADCQHVGNHYIYHSETDKTYGNDEYWVCCKCLKKFENNPGGTWVDINDLPLIDETNPDNIFYRVRRMPTKFVNHEKYLYKVGNMNKIDPSLIFDGADGLLVEKISTCSSCDVEFTNNQFKGTGVVKLIPTFHNAASKRDYVLAEIIDAYNACSNAVTASEYDVVWLNNVTGEFNVSNNCTVYGNGFTCNILKDSGAKFNRGFIELDNGNLDNVQIKCPLFSEAYLYQSQISQSDIVTYGTSTYQYFLKVKSAVVTNGFCKINNSFLYGGRANLNVVTGTTELDNCYLSTAAIANILNSDTAEKLILKDVITHQECVYVDGKPMDGVGVATCVAMDATQVTNIELAGFLKQINWADKTLESCFPSNTQTIVNYALQKGEIKHSIDGKDSVNLGFCYFNSEGKSISFDLIKQSVVDERIDKDKFPYLFVDYELFQEVVGVSYTYSSSNGTDPYFLDVEPYNPNKTIFTKGKLQVDEKYFTNNDCTFSVEYDSSVNDVVNTLVIKNRIEFQFKDIFIQKYNNDLTFKIYDKNNDEVTNNTYTPEFVETLNYSLLVTDNFNYDKEGNVIGDMSYKINFRIVSNVEEVPKPVLNSDTTYGEGLCVASSYGGTWCGAAPALEGIYIDYYSSKEKGVKTLELKSLTPVSKGKQNAANNTWTYSDPDNDFVLTLTGGIVHSGKNIYAMPVVCDGKLYFLASSTNGLVNSGNEPRSVTVSYEFKANGVTLTFNHTWSVAENKDNEYKYSDFCNGTLTKLESSGSSECLTGDTLITLKNGEKARIDSLNVGDEIQTFDHFNGCLSTSKIAYVYKSYLEYNKITANFENGVSINILQAHSFYSFEDQKYIEISPKSVSECVGKHFFNADTKTFIKLASYSLDHVNDYAYSILTEYDINHVANGFLAMSDEIEGLYNYFDCDENMKYIEEKMNQDIETYGLLSYEQFKDYCTEYEFEVFNCKYLGISVGKGLTTFESLIERMLRFTGKSA